MKHHNQISFHYKCIVNNYISQKISNYKLCPTDNLKVSFLPYL
ncbi:hypothetical protein SAMN05444484_108156 [Flavobacterium chilense]|uniref:Uncharacterized protein n=1 Tax=Flavobacterium chilense TaxID=946677 RepID=A0A1M7KWV0_9FLAO|nr:hypothetical protein SAMN05444484_108156 [Flavobacterium chilense]